MTESTLSLRRRDGQAAPGERPKHKRHQQAVAGDAFAVRLPSLDVETQHGSATDVESEATGRVYAPASARGTSAPAPDHEPLVEHVDTSTSQQRPFAAQELSSDDQ